MPASSLPLEQQREIPHFYFPSTNLGMIPAYILIGFTLRDYSTHAYFTISFTYAVSTLHVYESISLQVTLYMMLYHFSKREPFTRD